MFEKSSVTKSVPIFVKKKFLPYFIYLETVLHVSGGTTTHHQERIQCIYSIWYLSHRYCYLPLSWKSFNSSTIALTVWQIPDAVDTIVCAPDDRWWYHLKHVEQFPDINKLCNVASCWIYIGISMDKLGNAPWIPWDPRSRLWEPLA